MHRISVTKDFIWLILLSWLGLLGFSVQAQQPPAKSLATSLSARPTQAEANAFRQSLTPAERQLLAQLPRLTLAPDPDYPPFEYLDANGRYQGLVADYMRLFSALLEVPFEVLEVKHFDQAVSLVEQGVADLGTTHVESDLLKQTFDFGQQTYYPQTLVLLGRKTQAVDVAKLEREGGTLVSVDGWETDRNIVLGKYPKVDFFGVKDTLSGLIHLSSGVADIMVTSLPVASYYAEYRGINNLTLVESLQDSQLTGDTYYSKAGNQLLLGILDKAMLALSQNTKQRLRRHWMPPISNLGNAQANTQWYDKDTQDYIKQLGSIRVVAPAELPPVSFVAQDDYLAGMAIDWVDYLGSQMGLHIHWLEDSGLQSASEFIAAGHAELVLADTAAVTDLAVKNELFNSPYKLYGQGLHRYIYDLSELKHESVAVVAPLQVFNQLVESYPLVRFSHSNSLQHAFSRLLGGHVSGVVASLLPASDYLQNNGLTSVQVMGDTSHVQVFALMSDPHWQPLIEALGQAEKQLKLSEKQKIQREWLVPSNTGELDFGVMLKVALISAVLLAILGYRNRRMSRLLKQKRHLAEALEKHQGQLEQMVSERTEELQQSEARFRRFFESNAMVMLVIDPNSRQIVSANEAASAYYGYPLKTLIGMSVFDINKSDPKQVALAESNSKRGFQKISDYKHQLADGRLRDVDIYSTPIEVDGKILSFAVVLDITEQRQAQQRIAFQAMFDALTGLPNRFQVLELMAKRRQQQPFEQFSVIFVDIDHFKRINDFLGHDVGDQVLVEVGGRIRQVVGEFGSIGRLGGDEFLILSNLTPNKSRKAFEALMEDLLSEIAAPIRSGDRQLNITVSIGVAVANSAGCGEAELMRDADVAMYQAKANGRNNYRLFSHEMRASLQRQVELEEQLRYALEHDELSVFYQPKYCLNSDQVVGFEALLRWQQSDGNWVSPAEFIPIAEQCGEIDAIGRFVIEQGVAQIAKWYDQTGIWLKLAVNLSPSQFRDLGLVDFIGRTLKQHQVSSELLELEITEGVFLSGHADVEEGIRGLNQLGVSLAMDDFGTGYSSLSYLRRFPFDVVKIDRTFIVDLQPNTKDYQLVTAAIAMANSLGLAVVAEGVETEQQLDLLARIGCHLVQGYYIAKPLPPEQAIEVLCVESRQLANAT
ncbi:EAL domain-containing protein [Paraferrimonas sedimenticola]|uniref:PAS domain S-box-containing protein/diguanylate cyclase (GGDEF) domain-containing protein n=1 Tax=Paraferrimonas sedimenticola TaxID=375674 RepID=A0AA37W0B8_9GAMM|nr:EAL domain-containing protein [Paraferrimonas sedimenticola]GLP94827.1 hypothetical protein GCM10007895_01330 [Paraferrimonas sedimenticola]